MNKSMSLTTRLVVSMFIVPILMAVAIAFQGFRQSEDSKSRLDYFILTSVPSIELLERIRYTLAKHTATLNHAVLVYKEDKSVIDKLDAHHDAMLAEAAEQDVADADEAADFRRRSRIDDALTGAV